MPSDLTLTGEQRRAASAPQRRVYMESAPGSGKTTVAAERFGFLRYGFPPDGRAVLGLAFTRSAAAELRTRVLSRWGRASLTWPNRIDTLDAFIRDILMFLLRTGRLSWPGGRRELVVSDTWEVWGVSTWRRDAPRLAPHLRIDQGEVICEGSSRFLAPLAEGHCTHAEVRAVVGAALSCPILRSVIGDFVRRSVSAVVIDEAFDANDLDLRILTLLCEEDLPMTLVGDPWQALYEFRGARPLLVERLLAEQDFHESPLRRSFRFRSPATQSLADGLRLGVPVVVPVRGPGGKVDVALAAGWAELWDLDPEILPLSFGQPTSGGKALATLLLNRFTSTALGSSAVFLKDALHKLDLPHDVDLTEELDGVLHLLREGGAGASDAAGDRLIGAVRKLGMTRTRLVRGENFRKNLQDLGRRVASDPVGFIPGLTVHQAKGREWDTVGFLPKRSDLAALRSGLSHHRIGDRLIYVALTRGRLSTTLLDCIHGSGESFDA
ncbi:UvrD-helicase domain-containing protein [Planomonospora sp. ID82291]|uniref:UvrD-helicase domain-containing protein n=1 Tax=Planomonospora sp. ID82291 TaxID=2738136 RepID=UPI0018C3734B|nr:UvrD-helicase domain-containing protein [Planomonospora sp. ID82291]MBG0813325.1 UvrD-helicase domain-containing protein [Planomonospora sp. ID82291]